MLGYFPFGQTRKLTRQSKTQGWSLERHNPKSPRSKGGWVPRGRDRTRDDRGGGPGGLGPSSSHLGSSCDRSVGSQVQAPLTHPHHRLIALVSGLCDIFVDLLGGRETREVRLQASYLCSQLCKDNAQSPHPLGARLCQVTAGSGHPQEISVAGGVGMSQLGQAGKS